MRPQNRHSLQQGRRQLVAPALVAVACVALLLAILSPAKSWARAGAALGARAHAACSGPNSAKAPCYFSTPSGKIRCMWTPASQSVECELLATKRAYLLRPTGKAEVVKARLRHRGETLPTNQNIVFPKGLSCHDTNTTMTCDQDFLTGFFKLGPKGSRSG